MSRLRDLAITIGDLPPGPANAITDVPGVLVGHTTLIYDEPRVARTGVTVIMPRNGEVYQNQCYGAYHSFNGNGEMTGVHWLAESRHDWRADRPSPTPTRWALCATPWSNTKQRPIPTASGCCRLSPKRMTAGSMTLTPFT